MKTSDKQRKEFESLFLKDVPEVAIKYFIKTRNPLTEGRIMREVEDADQNERAIKAVLVKTPKGFVVTTDEDQTLTDGHSLVVTDKKDGFDVYFNAKSNILKADIAKSLTEGKVCASEIEDKDVGLMFKHFQESIKERTIAADDEQRSI